MAAVELQLSLLQRELERHQPGLLPKVASLRNTVRGATDRPGHLGLPGMRDRVTVAGGTLTIESREHEGTTVRIWLPTDGPGESAGG